MLADFLKFFDSIMIEKQLYWKFESYSASEVFYEFQWSKEGADHWRYRNCGSASWISLEAENLPFTVDRLGVGQDAFENELRRNILQQVVFADMILQKTIDFLGKATVERAICDNKKFMEQLIDVIRKLTNADGAAAVSQAHEQSKAGPTPKSSHLRII